MWRIGGFTERFIDTVWSVDLICKRKRLDHFNHLFKNALVYLVVNTMKTLLLSLLKTYNSAGNSYYISVSEKESYHVENIWITFENLCSSHSLTVNLWILSLKRKPQKPKYGMYLYA